VQTSAKIVSQHGYLNVKKTFKKCFSNCSHFVD
jgi:hypothetical protein